MQIFGSCVAIAAAISASAFAGAPAGDPVAMIEAAKQLSAEVKATSSPLPESDGPLVRKAFDPVTVRSLPTTDLKLISQSCEAIGQAMIDYGGYMGRMGEKTTEAEATRAYDDVVLGTAAANFCAERAFSAVERAISKMPAENRGKAADALQIMRAGAKMTLEGMLELLALPEFKPTTPAVMIDAALEHPEIVASSFPVGERAEFRDKIRSYLPRVGTAIRPKVEALAAAYAKSDCNLSCKAASLAKP